MTLIRKELAVVIILLFVGSNSLAVISSIAQNNGETDISTNEDTYYYGNFERYLLPQHLSLVIPDYNIVPYFNIGPKSQNIMSLQPIISDWPMFGHDIYHTGRCSYNTNKNLGQTFWLFETEIGALSSPVIADDETIYIGSITLDAVYPNGTLKWSHSNITLETAPAIDDNGTIYCGNVRSDYHHFNAIYPNGTTKWCVYINRVIGSPVISGDGTIIAPESVDNKIVALYPSNGTRKWEFLTNDYIYSSPAIGLDGTIYCGCHDGNIYALNPNGTLRWKYLTGAWVHGSPSIGIDGTVYCGSDDGYLYAIDPANGTMKWRLLIGESYASPTIDLEGTLYIGVWEKKFYAINPNGTIKWSFDTSPGKVWGSTAALSGDGTLYFGTCDLEWSGGVEIIALWINGTVKWRRPLDTVFSSPAISRNGIVYIGSRTSMGDGYLNAFGPLDPNAPSAPTIQGQSQGKIKKEYSYNFSSNDPLDKDVWYYISWGDETVQDWFGPYPSGEKVTLPHRWELKGTFKIEARAKNTDNLWGPYGTLDVTMPFSYDIPFQQFWMRVLERFPNAFPILRFLLEFN